MRVARQYGYAVVWATHPDRPNFTMNARGRKIHLALSHGKKHKTLCNMIVAAGVEMGSSEENRQMCQSCKVAATMEYKEKISKTTYSFTINTDASFHSAHSGIASWACWIKGEHYLIQQAGLLPDGVPNSSVAELLAVEQALLLLDTLINSEAFLRDHLNNGRIMLYFNTDSQFVVQALKGTIRKVKYADIIDRVSGMVERYEIVPRHVKGHTKGSVPREWVNNWCDKNAKRLADARLEELNERAKTTEKV